MNTDRKIQLQGLSTNWTALRSIQLHFTGGISSEELAASERGNVDREFTMNLTVPHGQSKPIPITDVAIKVTGTQQIYGIKFTYATGANNILFEADAGTWKTKPIPKGKEIIGLYGNANEEHIYSLGFILWEPNPMAV